MGQPVKNGTRYKKCTLNKSKRVTDFKKESMAGSVIYATLQM